MVWQTGMEESENEDGKESEPCGACTALSGQVFHIDNIPKKPHKHCKCGTVPLRLHNTFAQIDERLDELEGKVRKIKKNWSDMTEEEKEKARIKVLAEFRKSSQPLENANEAMKYKNLGYLDKVHWLKSKVRTGAEWDYKKDGHPENEHVGNFNYGVVGRAAGFSEEELLRGAGIYQMTSGTSQEEYGGVFAPYGDDPVDQSAIRLGFSFYDSIYGK